MCGAENDVFLYMAYKATTIVLIFDKYHQFRIWCKFVGINFSGEKYISSTTKDMEVKCFGFVTQENLLRCSLLETFNRCVIVYMSYSFHCKFPPGI